MEWIDIIYAEITFNDVSRIIEQIYNYRKKT